MKVNFILGAHAAVRKLEAQKALAAIIKQKAPVWKEASGQ